MAPKRKKIAVDDGDSSSGSHNGGNAFANCVPDVDPEDVAKFNELKNKFASMDFKTFASNLTSNLWKSFLDVGAGEGSSKQKKKEKVPSPSKGPSKPVPSPKTGFNVTGFSGVVKSLDARQRKAIRSYGFQCLLDMDKCNVPLSFSNWIAKRVDCASREIVFSKLSIQMDPLSVHRVLGLPVGGRYIDFSSSSSKSDFLDAMKVRDGVRKIPPASYFVGLLDDKSLDDDMVVRCFLVVALALFLCPSSTREVSPFYVEPLLDIKSARTWDWSKLVFEWLLKKINNYQHLLRANNFNSASLGGCHYYLSVLYLDHLNFGEKQLPSSVFPRNLVWKGSRVKKFLELDYITAGVYGRKNFKRHDQTCYCLLKERNVNLETDFVYAFKEELNKAVNYSFPYEVLSEYTDIYLKHSVSSESNSKECVRGAVIDSVKYFYDALMSKKLVLNRGFDNAHNHSGSKSAANNDHGYTYNDNLMSSAGDVNLAENIQYDHDGVRTRSQSVPTVGEHSHENVLKQNPRRKVLATRRRLDSAIDSESSDIDDIVSKEKEHCKETKSDTNADDPACADVQAPSSNMNFCGTTHPDSGLHDIPEFSPQGGHSAADCARSSQNIENAPLHAEYSIPGNCATPANDQGGLSGIHESKQHAVDAEINDANHSENLNNSSVGVRTRSRRAHVDGEESLENVLKQNRYRKSVVSRKRALSVSESGSHEDSEEQLKETEFDKSHATAEVFVHAGDQVPDSSNVLKQKRFRKTVVSRRPLPMSESLPHEDSEENVVERFKEKESDAISVGLAKSHTSADVLGHAGVQDPAGSVTFSRNLHGNCGLSAAFNVCRGIFYEIQKNGSNNDEIFKNASVGVTTRSQSAPIICEQSHENIQKENPIRKKIVTYSDSSDDSADNDDVFLNEKEQCKESKSDPNVAETSNRHSLDDDCGGFDEQGRSNNVSPHADSPMAENPGTPANVQDGPSDMPEQNQHVPMDVIPVFVEPPLSVIDTDGNLTELCDCYITRVCKSETGPSSLRKTRRTTRRKH